MLKFRNLVIERLLDKLREIDIGNFNKKLVFEDLDEIRFKTVAKTVKLNIGLKNIEGYIKILNGNNVVYYNKTNSSFWKSANTLTLNVNSTEEIIIKAAFITHFSCNDNQITELNLSKSKHLDWLECRNNLLTNLDFTKKNIYLINCDNNKQLANISFNSNNIETKSLSYHNTGISVLELNKLPNLESLNCSFCANISAIDISNNKKLQSVICNNCSLSTLNIDNNPRLAYLNCSNNKITAINTSKNQKLWLLGCNNNKLENLDIKNNENIKILNCSKNKLKNLDISGNPKLLNINCYKNLLDSSALINLLNQLLKIESNERKYLFINDNLHSDLSNPKELADALRKLKEKGWEMLYG